MPVLQGLHLYTPWMPSITVRLTNAPGIFPVSHLQNQRISFERRFPFCARQVLTPCQGKLLEGLAAAAFNSNL